jgi:cytochrome c6
MRCCVRRLTEQFCMSLGLVLALGSTAFGQDKLAGDNRASNGRQVFMQARCFACHGEYGFGGVGPRFRENRFLGLGDYVIGQILVGRGIMPSFADALNNDQIAAVASYIRSSWGNDFGAVKAQQVVDVRKQVKLHPPQGRPHLKPSSAEPPGGAQPPSKAMPPGQALPPG